MATISNFDPTREAHGMTPFLIKEMDDEDFLKLYTFLEDASKKNPQSPMNPKTIEVWDAFSRIVEKHSRLVANQ